MNRIECPHCGRKIDETRAGRLAFHQREPGEFCPGSLRPAPVASLMGRPLPAGWTPRPQAEGPAHAHR